MLKSLLSGITFVTLVAGPLVAQDGPQRQGFWIGFGLGAGVNLSQGLDDKSHQPARTTPSGAGSLSTIPPALPDPRYCKA